MASYRAGPRQQVDKISVARLPQPMIFDKRTKRRKVNSESRKHAQEAWFHHCAEMRDIGAGRHCDNRLHQTKRRFRYAMPGAIKVGKAADSRPIHRALAEALRNRETRYLCRRLPWQDRIILLDELMTAYVTNRKTGAFLAAL